MGRFMKGMLAAVADAMGVNSELIGALASDFPVVQAEMGAALPSGVIEEATYHLSQFLYGTLVSEVFGQTTCARVGLEIARRAGRSGDEAAARHERFSTTVYSLVEEGARYAGLSRESRDYVLSHAYMAVKLALAMSDIDDGDLGLLDQAVGKLLSAMQRCGVRLHYLRGLHRGGR